MSRSTPRRAETFVRHQAATLVATACDFGVYAALALGLGVAAPAAALVGAAVGAVVHFSLARARVFRDAGAADLGGQAARYAASAALIALANAGGVALFVGGLGPMPARLVTSVVVAVLVSWPLHRYWVFPPAPSHRGDVAEHA